MEELLDILDENGNLIDVKTRADAHAKGLWHKSVHVWVINSKNEILLQKRSKNKKFFPSFWDCAFAGHVDSGESSLLTAVREGNEELGLKIDEKKLKFLFTNKESISHDNITNNEFVDIYVYEADVDLDNLLLQQEEVEDVAWVSLPDFESLLNNSSSLLHHDVKEYIKLFEYLQSNYVFI